MTRGVEIRHVVIANSINRLVEQAAARGLLDSTYSIDSTHLEAIQYNDAASWNYDPAAEEYYYGFGFAVILSDMWLVVDLLGQISLTVKQRLKPRVPARTFLNIVRKEMPVM